MRGSWYTWGAGGRATTGRRRRLRGGAAGRVVLVVRFDGFRRNCKEIKGEKHQIRVVKKC